MTEAKLKEYFKKKEELEKQIANCSDPNFLRKLKHDLNNVLMIIENSADLLDKVI